MTFMQEKRLDNAVSPPMEDNEILPLEEARRQSVVGRLKVLKTAWILGSGDVPQAWFS